MSKTLKIKNVDFKLLERQRLCLSNVVYALEQSDFTSGWAAVYAGSLVGRKIFC